jgi:hypothetical protein
MIADDKLLPNNVYPRDVTSPGPDQRPGVVRADRAIQSPPPPPKPPVPPDRDKPRQPA